MIEHFLRTNGQDIETDQGQKILLKGWGIGNWLLTEGYMWDVRGQRFDRPRRISQVISELIEPDASATFWRQYREIYFTEADVKYIHDQGYNSIRIPFNASLFLDDQGEFAPQQLALLDQVIAWAKRYDLYVWLDMHGAPGGQTGANIDDSVADVPNLFIVPEYWRQGLLIWQKLAEHYHDEPAVAGYDLLNEPIRPGTSQLQDFDYLLPKLAQFYEEAIEVIRATGSQQLVSLEGYHWASDPSVFVKKFDDQMVIHFHRYGVFPDQATLADFLQIRAQYNVPLWLGETGENTPLWFAGMAKLCQENNISYHFWPYKKMGKYNSCVTIEKPAGWDSIQHYVDTGERPDQATCQRLFAEFLENAAWTNCTKNQAIDRQLLLQPPYRLAATSFDDGPAGAQGLTARNNYLGIRQGTNIDIQKATAGFKKAFTFDIGYDDDQVHLHEQEWVAFTFNATESGQLLKLQGDPLASGTLTVTENDQYPRSVTFQRGIATIELHAFAKNTVRLQATTSPIMLKELVLTSE